MTADEWTEILDAKLEAMEERIMAKLDRVILDLAERVMRLEKKGNGIDKGARI